MKKITKGKFQTNTYVLESKGEYLVIDPGYDVMDDLNDIKGSVSGILLTHCHCDHIDAIGNFKCPIYIHEKDYKGLNDKENLYCLVGDIPNFDVKKLNIITFSSEEQLSISRFTIDTFHTPGHTAGSSCYLYKDMLFTGDTLFKESIGRTDFPSGDHKTILKSLKELAKLDPKIRVFPGHGEQTTIKEEKKNNIFLKTL